MPSIDEYTANLTMASEEHAFPLWVGVNRDTKTNQAMSFIHDVWANRDYSCLLQIEGALSFMNLVSFKGGVFDVKTVKHDNTDNALIVHTCEFKRFSFCNWNELMVMKDNASGGYYYTPLRLHLGIILSESIDEWIKVLSDDGYFYINGTADVSSDGGKLEAFGIEGLNYRAVGLNAHGLALEQTLMVKG